MAAGPSLLCGRCPTDDISYGKEYEPIGKGGYLTLRSASHDILRLYDLEEKPIFKHSTVNFLIIPGMSWMLQFDLRSDTLKWIEADCDEGHRTGIISQLYLDPTCKYLMSASGNRGWEGSSTEVLLGYEVIGVDK